MKLMCDILSTPVTGRNTAKDQHGFKLFWTYANHNNRAQGAMPDNISINIDQLLNKLQIEKLKQNDD